jgi:hypothetical protein
VPVPYFLLILCFRKVTQEIFSELDEKLPLRPLPLKEGKKKKKKKKKRRMSKKERGNGIFP